MLVGSLVIGGAGPLHAATKPASEPMWVGVVSANPQVVEAAIEGANAAGGTWKTLHPEPLAPQTAVSRTVQELTAAYLEADFLHCLVLSQEPAIQIEKLVLAGQLQAASDAGLVAAACLAAVDETQRARAAVRRLLSLALPAPTTWAATKPDFKALVQAERKEAAQQPTFSVQVKTAPFVAEIAVDGRPIPCPQHPCSLKLGAGEHFIAAASLGYRASFSAVVVDGPTSVTLTLDPASAREALLQWSNAMATGQSVISPEMLRVAALAADAAISVGVAKQKSGVFEAVAFDRGKDRIAARAQAQSAKSAANLVVATWRAQNKPPLVSKSVWIWGAVGTAVLSAGLAAYFFTRDTSPRYDLVFTPKP